MRPDTSLSSAAITDQRSNSFNETTFWSLLGRLNSQSSPPTVLWMRILQYIRRTKNIVVSEIHSDCVTMFQFCNVRSGFFKSTGTPGPGGMSDSTCGSAMESARLCVFALSCTTLLPSEHGFWGIKDSRRVGGRAWGKLALRWGVLRDKDVETLIQHRLISGRATLSL